MKKTILAILLGHLLFMVAPACSSAENDAASKEKIRDKRLFPYARFEDVVLEKPPPDVVFSVKPPEESKKLPEEEISRIRWLREGKPRNPLDGKTFVCVTSIYGGAEPRIYFNDWDWIWDYALNRDGGKFSIDEAGQIQTGRDHIQGFYDVSSGKLIWAGQKYVPETEFFRWTGAILGMLVCGPGPVFGLHVSAPKDAREAFEWSDAVFVGEAVEVYKDAFGRDSYVFVHVDPDRIWKAKKLPSKIQLYGDIWPIHSARIFIVGRKYLFYVNYQSIGPTYRYGNRVAVSEIRHAEGRHRPFLIRVIPLEEAAEDINSLSEPRRIISE